MGQYKNNENAITNTITNKITNKGGVIVSSEDEYNYEDEEILQDIKLAEESKDVEDKEILRDIKLAKESEGVDVKDWLEPVVGDI